ncbi:permease [Paenibacillus harenae]|uniref:Permease n=1 Tax=Paenibacillus harenae TaxID=306543 RepID=A0ABT9U1E2_PAEHA|nr:permease [Paenibacillus harenae]MDQ0113451.1 hypothetical protein [Paenibacillus harenae]
MVSAYNNFKLAIYCTASCLDSSFDKLAQELDFFAKHLYVSKVYIENHRGDVSLSKERLLELKQFLNERGIEAAGGITPTLGSSYRPGYERLFGGICYTDAASRAAFQAAVETAASVFDEIIFDDFFFTNCGCDDCLEAKGERTWEQFRLELMTEVSANLIKKPAKSVNPNVKLVIKYPNWNEAYQASGYNTETQPAIFEGVYTGTETRDPAISQQHIPRYASYSLLRWMDQLSPDGGNGGAWFDSLDCTYIDYYLEQANLSVYGKARELTLFCYSLLKDSVYVPALGFQLEKLDKAAGQLGRPLGVHVYEPHHAKGEDHLYDYLGMLGIPMELSPHFPGDGKPLLLTANAARDEGIIERMKGYLKDGGHIIMTSGFLERMHGKGAEQFTTLHPTGKKLAVQQFAIDTASCTFDTFTLSAEPLSYPIFDYSTNGTWQSIVALKGHNNIPILMYDNYGRGKIHTLIIPDDYADLWKLPSEVVTKIRSVMTGKLLPYQLEGPAHVGLFAYDNGSLVIESFASQPQKWCFRLPEGMSLQAPNGGRPLKSAGQDKDGSSRYEIKLAPSTMQLLRVTDSEQA